LELARILRTLWRRRLLVVIGLNVAMALAYASAYKVSFPPSFEPDSIEFGAASAQLLLDAGRSPLVNVEEDIDPLSARAQVFARLVESDAVHAAIANAGGFQPGEIVVAGRTANPDITRSAREPAAEQRALQLAGDVYVKRLLVVAEPELPVLSFYAQAATPQDAIRLADAGAKGLAAYIRAVETRQRTPAGSRIQLRELGAASGGWVNPGASTGLAVVTFLGISVLWCVAVIFGSSIVSALGVAARSNAGCKECGSDVPDGASFCPACGVRTTAEPDEPGGAAATVDVGKIKMVREGA